jgi:hypothetical protein
MKAVHEILAPARKALDEAITADTLDENAIRAKAAEVAAAEADAAVLRARVHQKAFGVLTDDQKAKVKELKGRMEQRMKEGRGRGRGPGRGPAGMMEHMIDRFLHQPAPAPAQDSDNLSEQESGRPEVV